MHLKFCSPTAIAVSTPNKPTSSRQLTRPGSKFPLSKYFNAILLLSLERRRRKKKEQQKPSPKNIYRSLPD
jgi:hypothetical protein